jgi:alpha-glucuronidase
MGTRHVTADIELHSGDVLKVVGRPQGGEPAPLDYVELIPHD